MKAADASHGAGAPLAAALGLISAATTAQQIALMQVLGWMHWHHFAYLVVAVALLGFGMAGTGLSLAREHFVRRATDWLPWLLAGAALTTPLGVRLAQLESLAVDLPVVFFEPAGAWRLALLCLLLLPPFFCAGLATGLVLTVHAGHAGRYYAASLAGAGAGGIAGLALVATTEPPRLAPACAVLAVAAFGFLWRTAAPSARSAGLTAAALAGLFWFAPGELTSSQFKPLRRTLDLPEARVTAQRPGVHGWVQIVSAPALRPAPAVSFDFAGEIPPHPAVFVNGVPYGSLPAAHGGNTAGWLDFTTDAAAFAAFPGRPPRHVALLENGPGGWAALAQRQGAARVSIVEPNDSLVRLLTADGPARAEEWTLPTAHLARQSGRAFLRQGREPLDVIRFPTVGAFGGSAGLAAASEQFLLTREALTEAWQRLSPEGVIAVTAWMDFPERNPLRLLATLVETLEAAGAAPRAHLAAVRGWAAVTFLVRRSHWNPDTTAALRAFCTARGFDPLLLPDLVPAEREAHHAWQNPQFFTRVDQLVDGPREPLYRDYPFSLRPPTDRQPYFSQFLRWTRTEPLREVFGTRAMPFFELGSLVIALTFGILVVLALAGILLPLCRIGWHAPGKPGVLLYFSGLGAGFMAVEIGLMLRAQTWTGSPVLGAAIVITSLLIASGLGSLWSERMPAGVAAQRRAAAVILGLVLLATLLFNALDSHASAWPRAGQLALLLTLTGILGAAMGTAFPLGLRQLAPVVPAQVPWAWAINGCVSVATPAGAMLLAIQAGFDAVLLLAAAAYALALLGTFFTAGSARQSVSRAG